jgi:hypothetical protein
MRSLPHRREATEWLTNGIRFTQLERQRLKQLRYQGHAPTLPEAVNAA